MRRNIEEPGPGHGQDFTNPDRRHGPSRHGRALAGCAVGSDNDGGAGIRGAHQGAVVCAHGELRVEDPPDTYVHRFVTGLCHHGCAAVTEWSLASLTREWTCFVGKLML